MVEARQIDIRGTSSKACDKTRHDMVHAEKDGEPMSPVDFRLYRIALEEHGGVPKEDAKRQVKGLRSLYANSSPFIRAGIAETMSQAFDGLVGLRGQRELVRAEIKPQEVVVFRRRR